MTTQVQPGSLDAEAGIYASAFDMSGTRLITGEADKTIKIWREVSQQHQQILDHTYLSSRSFDSLRLLRSCRGYASHARCQCADRADHEFISVVPGEGGSAQPSETDSHEHGSLGSDATSPLLLVESCHVLYATLISKTMSV